MKKENLLIASLVLINGSAFYLAVISDFFIYKGLTISEGLSLIALYQLMVVILEFPTGVIGDKFGHKISVSIGGLLNVFGLLFLTFNNNYYAYYVYLFIAAVGISLISGSDFALLSNSSKEFKDSISKYSSIGLIFQIIVITLGSVFYSYIPELPFIITIILIFIGVILLQFTDTESHQKIDTNFITTIKDSIRSILTNNKLTLLILSSGFLIATFGPIKWLISIIFSNTSITSAYWGGIFSTLFIGRAIGTKIATKLESKYSIIFATILFLSMFLSMSIKNPYAIYIGLLFMSISFGVLEVELSDLINKNVHKDFKASTNSLKSLIARFASSVVIYVIGIYTAQFSYRAGLFFLGVSGLFTFIFICAYFIIENRKQLVPRL